MSLVVMLTALQRQLGYMNPDGSFNQFRDYQEYTPSTWYEAIIMTLSITPWRHFVSAQRHLIEC